MSHDGFERGDVDVDAIPDPEPRVVSKAAFNGLLFALVVPITIAESVIAIAICHALGQHSRDIGGIVAGMGFPNLILARVAVDRILRALGRSRSGRTVERRGRTTALPEGTVDDDEVAEIRYPKGFVRFLFWGSLGFCVFFGVGPSLFYEGSWMTWSCYCFSALFGLSVLNVWWDRKPQAWADREGVIGYPIGFRGGLSRRFVPWSDVATCEIETYFDTFGQQVLIRPILKGWRGETLMMLQLLWTSIEDQQRLVKYIKARLPKPKDDLWE